MKKKENQKKNIIYKLNSSGISLIVLVITIIVIIILAAAIIITLNKSNPIEEANIARYESDRDSMQAIFTNTVAKVMAVNQGTMEIKESILNDVKSGVSSTTGETTYTLNNPEKNENKNGRIIFDNGSNTEVNYYTGRKLPIYSAGETIWSVDSQGVINLKVGEKIIGDNENNEGENGEQNNNNENATISGIKTDVYIYNELSLLTAHESITSMNGFTRSTDQNNKISEYLTYDNTNGYTVLKSGWYFINLSATAYGDSSNAPSVYLEFVIDGKMVASVGHYGLQGVHDSDNSSFPIFLKQGQKFYFVASGVNRAWFREQTAKCYPMF